MARGADHPQQRRLVDGLVRVGPDDAGDAAHAP
jgi:hypothetical protein